jgi:uncharacterized OB-fold protein
MTDAATEQPRPQKFAPPEDLPAFHEPFWDSVNRREIALQKCDTCGKFRFIPSEICSNCGGESWTWTPISGRGTVYTYTVVHRAPTPAYQADAPYVIAHVEMEEGPRMISNLVRVDPAQVTIGQPVKIDYEDRDGATVFVFAPA